MSKGLKRTLRYSAIILGLVVVALLVAPFFIDVNKYRNQISQAVEDATGRKLSIGAMQASLFPWIGVRLEDVHLANREGFADRDFASIKSLDVRLELMPLFSGRYEIKRFELDQPEVYLERHADGETNWGDLAGSGAATAGTQAPAEEKKPAASSSVLAGLQAKTISLTGGSVTWADQQGDLNLTLTDLAVRLDDVQLKRPVGVDVSGKLGGDPFRMVAQVGPLGELSKFDPAHLPVKGELTVDHLGLKNFKAKLAGWPAMLGRVDDAAIAMDAKLEQRPDGLRVGEGSVKLEAAHKVALQWKADMQTADRVEIRRVLIDMDGRQLAEMHGEVDKLGSDAPGYQLRLASEPIERTWLAGFVPELNTLYAAHPAPWKQIKVGMLLAGSSDHVDLRDLQLLLDGELVQASGSVTPGKNGPNIRLRVATNDLHIDPWLPQPQARQPAATPVAPVAATAAGNETEPDLRFLKGWRVAAQVQAGTLHLRGLSLQNMRVTVNGVDGKFDLNPLRFGLSGGQVEEKATLNAATYPARWTESVHVSGVQVGPVLKALADMDMLEGDLSMDTSFSGTGLTQSAVKTLGGHGNVILRDGKVRGFDIAGTLRKLANPMAETGPQETDFAQLSGSFKVSNGVARNDDLFMASPLLRVTGKGTVNLVQKILDYHVKPTLVGSLKGQGDTVAVRQGFSVPLHITGPFAAPKVSPEMDPATILQNLQGAGGGKKVGGVLGQILQGGQQKQTPQQQQQQAPQQQAPQQQPAPQKPLEKALEGLIKGL